MLSHNQVRYHNNAILCRLPIFRISFTQKIDIKNSENIRLNVPKFHFQYKQSPKTPCKVIYDMRIQR